MGVPLNYTFLGNSVSNTGNNNDEYTPLIVPGGFGTAGEVNDLIQPPTPSEPSTGRNAAPFSRIRNQFVKGNPGNNVFQTKQQMVNVLRDYMWTISPETLKTGSIYYNLGNISDETPYIEIKEKYFLVNSLIAQGLYTLTASGDLLGQSVPQGVKDFLRESGSKIRGFLLPGTTTLNQTGVETEEESPSTLSNIANNIGSFIQNLDLVKALEIINRTSINPDLESVLFPYQRLYLLGPTGFQYKFPYLESSVNNVSNQFSDSPPNFLGKLQNIINTGTNIAELAGAFNEIVGAFGNEAGARAGSARIERPKYYNYPESGEPITFKFPLFNTNPATYLDICNNYKLVFLLLYQNAPLRQDRLIVQPPVVYDLKIPGGRREPFCYISNISVNYIGATRMMDIDLSGITSTSTSFVPAGFVKTIIPDAYEIQISFQPMIAQTKNLMYSTIANEVVSATESELNDLETNPNAEGLGFSNQTYAPVNIPGVPNRVRSELGGIQLGGVNDRLDLPG